MDQKLDDSAITIDRELLEELRASVRAVLQRDWPDATHAGSGDLTQLWATAAEHGWTDLTELGSTAAQAVQEELGRVAAPLPVVDVLLAAEIMSSRGDYDWAARTASGDIRPVIAIGTTTGRPVGHWVEAADASTHMIIIDETSGTLALFDLDGATINATPGLPIPSWAEVHPAASALWEEPIATHSAHLTSRRIGLAARAMAAFARTHELAVDYAKTRVQFGKPIGAFQAVAHRLVEAQLSLTAASELLAHAGHLANTGDESHEIAAEIYLEFVAEHLPQLQFGAHHTLAATGYFDESEGPWLFRRVHSDLAALSAMAGERVGSRIAAGQLLPEWGRDASAQQVREEVIRAFEPWLGGKPSRLSTWDDAARDVLRRNGWIGVGWPARVGGGGWPITDVIAFSEAIAYVNPPLGNIWMGVNSIAPMVINVGSDTLRDLVLDEVRGGDLSIALGYSEPEAGSDLASLRTRADRVDDGWIINGQKSWGTCFPDSRWAVVAARTDASATPPHAGISLFLVDTDSAGITVSPHVSLAGDVSATTFWDDVFVPNERLIGEPNEGWSALMAALSGERALIGASVMRAHRSFEKLVALVSDKEAATAGRRDDVAREIGRLAVRLQAARALVNRAVRAATEGGGDRSEAPMAKIAASEFAEDLHTTAIALLGPNALYAWGTPETVGDGYFEDGLRSSIMSVVAGGTGDIQRNLIARTMGLPR